jgi:hypothetical protein
MSKKPDIGIRWTIGDVSDAGHQALRLSILGAWNIFGKRARYAVCVNTVRASVTAARIGALPCAVDWIPVTNILPRWLGDHVTNDMAEGVAWKLLPVRAFPELHELSLDNDVILWALPKAIKDWLAATDPNACLVAQDVQPGLGQFAAVSGYKALNLGIRGLPPHFDMEGRLSDKLLSSDVILQSELDEQGLQLAVLIETKLFVVSTEDVSICSPFDNHQHHLGRCGAHFVGVNPKRLPWILDGRGAHEVIREHWDSYIDEVCARVAQGRGAVALRNNGCLDLTVPAVS